MISIIIASVILKSSIYYADKIILLPNKKIFKNLELIFDGKNCFVSNYWKLM